MERVRKSDAHHGGFQISRSLIDDLAFLFFLIDQIQQRHTLSGRHRSFERDQRTAGIYGKRFGFLVESLAIRSVTMDHNRHMNQQSLRGSPLNGGSRGLRQLRVVAPGALLFDMLQLVPGLAYGFTPEIAFRSWNQNYIPSDSNNATVFSSVFSNQRPN